MLPEIVIIRTLAISIGQESGFWLPHRLISYTFYVPIYIYRLCTLYYVMCLEANTRAIQTDSMTTF